MPPIFPYREELQVTNTTQTIAPNTHSIGNQMMSFVGSVTRIISEEGVCIVDSDYMGKDARIPYSPESGVREGGACLIGVFQNVPRIIGALNFGNEEMVSLDPTGGDTGEDFIKVTEATQTGDYEKATGGPIGVRHKDGEKVLACDFSGIRAGIDHSIIFYEANSKVICTDGVATVAADNVINFSKGGQMSIECPEEGSSGSSATGAPLGISSTHTFELNDDHDEFTPIIVEYKGDVEKAMSNDEVTIGKLPSGDGISVSKFVYLFMILNSDVDKFSRNVSTVSHEYVNRKLSVDGGRGEDLTVNEKFKGVAGLSDDDLESFAIKGTIGGDDVAVVYLKGITIDGDIYEFNSGKSIRMHNSDKKSIELGYSKTYNAGRAEHYFQDNVRTIQHPISEDTLIYKEIFGLYINEIKGDTYNHSYRGIVNTLINTETIYEVDPSSDIETFDYVDSPVAVRKFTTFNEMFEENNDLSLDPYKLSFFNTNEKQITFSMNPASNFEYSCNTSNGNNSSVFMYGSGGFVYEAKNGFTNMISRFFHEKSDFNVFEGPSSFEEIIVDGNMFVTATNIILNAEDYIVHDANSFFGAYEESMYASYKKFFYVASEADTIIDSSGRAKEKPMLYMSDSVSYLSGDTTVVYGGDAAYAFAVENAAFGAKVASFFGGCCAC